MTKYLLPTILLLLFAYGLFKKAPLYDYFVDGAKGAVQLAVSIFPYITAMLILVKLLEVSNLTLLLQSVFQPVFSLFGIPKGLFSLILFRPFTGSGSIAILEDVFVTFGVNSYEARCASVIASSSDTIFYLSAIYFSSQGIKKLRGAIPIALFCSFVGVIITCLIMRF
ncbi:MAG: spore maturation protein, partial [Clostridia bacterium]